jgi:uncharacterized protein (DUF1501 family)
MSSSIDRRQFLGSAGALALNLAAIGSASAQASDYRALVCVFLFGGNDSFNMVLPTDTDSWNAYRTTRNQAPDPIALLAPGTAPDFSAAVGTPARLGGVLPIVPANAQGRAFALHPLLGSLQGLFGTQRRLAIVPNIGPLVMPTSKAQYGQVSHPKPARLFSHNDQQNAWQALAPEGAKEGWGGRIGDLLESGNGQAVFTAVSAAGNAVWLSGRNVRQYQVGNTGAVRMGVDGSGRVFGSGAVGGALQRIVSGARSGHLLEADLAAVSSRSIAAERLVASALRPPEQAPFGTPPAGTASYSQTADPKLMVLDPLTGSNTVNSLAQQLQIVARMIDAGRRGVLGVRRQVFFVSLGGFDNHDQQNRNHAGLMARLAHGLAYFDDTMNQLGALNEVTSFTASDFGRTFTSNGDGTDHGWGGHHFVLGGAVRGGDLYGRFPTLGVKNANNSNFDSSPDQLGNGALLPTTSIDQLGATLARWMGVSDGSLADIFPALGNFDASARDLGFMA